MKRGAAAVIVVVAGASEVAEVAAVGPVAAGSVAVGRVADVIAGKEIG